MRKLAQNVDLLHDWYTNIYEYLCLLIKYLYKDITNIRNTFKMFRPEIVPTLYNLLKMVKVAQSGMGFEPKSCIMTHLPDWFGPYLQWTNKFHTSLFRLTRNIK